MGLMVCHVGLVCTASLKKRRHICSVWTTKFRSCNLMVNTLCVVQIQMSVAQIEYAETMEKGKPKTGGLSDPWMGTVDRKIKCQTYMGGWQSAQATLVTLSSPSPCSTLGLWRLYCPLCAVCFNCSKILVDEVPLGSVTVQNVCVHLLVCLSGYSERSSDFKSKHIWYRS